jgi:hypothetical protein
MAKKGHTVDKGKITEKGAQKHRDQRREAPKRGVSNTSATSNPTTSFTSKNGCSLRQGFLLRTQRKPMLEIGLSGG